MQQPPPYGQQPPPYGPPQQPQQPPYGQPTQTPYGQPYQAPYGPPSGYSAPSTPMDIGMIGRYAIAAAVGIIGFVFIVFFFAMPWLDWVKMFEDNLDSDVADNFTDDFRGDEETATAFQVWTGGIVFYDDGDDKQSVALNSKENDGVLIYIDEDNGESGLPDGGILNVRLIDRLLILMPLWGLALIGLAVMYALKWKLPDPVALGVMAGIIVATLLFPVFWGLFLDMDLYESNNLTESLGLDNLSVGDAHVFTPYTILSIVGLMVVAAGFGLWYYTTMIQPNQIARPTPQPAYPYQQAYPQPPYGAPPQANPPWGSGQQPPAGGPPPNIGTPPPPPPPIGD